MVAENQNRAVPQALLRVLVLLFRKGMLVGLGPYPLNLVLLIAEIRNVVDEEMKKAAQELLEEQKRAIRQMVEEQKKVIWEAVEEEKKAIWSRVEELRQSISKIGLR